MWEIIYQLLPYAVAFTVPLLITALGGLFSERSGVVNIALEGLMLIGVFTGALVVSVLERVLPGTAIWLGLPVAAAAGAAFSLLHAFACISLNSNQVISGIAINMLAGAFTTYLARDITGSGNIQIVHGLTRYDIPFLSDLPVLGQLLFTQTYATTWLVLVIMLFSWFILQKTVFGLRLRSCGEHPQAAAAAGINVYRMRYLAVMLSGAFASLGGAIMLVTYGGEFSGTVAGLGFLSLAALIFGQWKPLGILAATFFFGLASTVANVSQAIPALDAIPTIYLKTFPYVLTLVALVLSSKSSQAPKALGEPYEQGKR